MLPIILSALAVLSILRLPGLAGTSRVKPSPATTGTKPSARLAGMPENHRTPKTWSETAPGVRTKLPTPEKVVALTLDACGGPGGDGYDAALLQYLRDERIPATLFISGRWLKTHRSIIRDLAAGPLFEIENHGLNHRPCSVAGRSVYGIKGTGNAAQVIAEIEGNAKLLDSLTGRRSRYYRPGTAYSDDVCPEIARQLNHEMIGFSVRGDAGATYSAAQVRKALLGAREGSIVVLHMNHPEKPAILAGLKEAIPELRRKGFTFVRLDGYSPSTPGASQEP